MAKDDFEVRTQKYLEDGRKNARDAELIEKWCGHIEITRGPGRGMLEAMTGVPIGHMGVQCEHATNGSMQCWHVRESFTNFYDRNCEGCSFRSYQGFPNAQHILDEHIQLKKEASLQRQKYEEEKLKSWEQRYERRGKLRNNNPNVIAVLDALNRLDHYQEKPKDEDGNKSQVSPQEELLELAKLAPEVWTEEILSYLYETCLSDASFALTEICARLTIELPCNEEQQARCCFRVVGKSSHDDALIRWACDNIEKALPNELDDLIKSAAYKASRSYSIMSDRTRKPELLRSLASHHAESVTNSIKSAYKENTGLGATLAARIVAPIAERYPELVRESLRDVLSWYVRWRTRDSSLRKYDDTEIPHLRDAAVAIFLGLSEEADEYLQSLMEGESDARKDDIDHIYQQAIKTKSFDEGSFPDPTQEERLAFKRLLWRAVDVVALRDYDARSAAQYFSNPEYINPKLGTGLEDTILGAAIALQSKAESVEAEPLIHEPANPWLGQEKRNQKNSIRQLRENFIGLAMLSARHSASNAKGLTSFYSRIPDEDADLQSAFVSQLHRLVVDANDLNEVMSVYYASLYSDHTLVRYSAIKSIWKLRYSLLRDLPNLMHETLLLQLSDSFVLVHKTMVSEMRSHLIPSEFQPRLKQLLITIVFIYYNEDSEADFVYRLLEKLLPLLTTEEIRDGFGAAMLAYAEKQSDMDRCKFAEEFTYKLRNIPGTIKFFIEQFRSDWALRVSRDRLFSGLDLLPSETLTDFAADLLDVAKADCVERPQRIYKWVRILTEHQLFDQAYQLSAFVFGEVEPTKKNIEWISVLTMMKAATAIESNISQSSCIKNSMSEWTSELTRYNNLEKGTHGKFLPF